MRRARATCYCAGVTTPHDGTPHGSTAQVARVFAFTGAAVFALSLIYFLYSYQFRFGAPAETAAALPAIALDVALFTVFAAHHSLFARSGAKAWVAARAGAALERSVYTWIASLLFIVVCAAWALVPGELYALPGVFAAAGYGVQLAGLVVTARSSAKLDVLDLAGIRAVVRAQRGDVPEHVPLETRGLYGFVRHPLYFGWLLVVFGTPHMTMTRFLFAAVSGAYLAIAIPFEERSLIRTFGEAYRDYQRQVRWRMLPGIY